MEPRRTAADPGRVTAPDRPEEHQGWGVEGYAGGQAVPSAETPGWGAQGQGEGIPVLLDPTAGRAPGPAAGAPAGPIADPARSGDGLRPESEPQLGPGDEDEPGPHPASVLAGR